jgi:hypothetical protein
MRGGELYQEGGATPWNDIWPGQQFANPTIT